MLAGGFSTDVRAILDAARRPAESPECHDLWLSMLSTTCSWIATEPRASTAVNRVGPRNACVINLASLMFAAEPTAELMCPYCAQRACATMHNHAQTRAIRHLPDTRWTEPEG